MATTYLQATNKVLRRLNEVELTSANFATATGFHAHAKDAVNAALEEIHSAHTEWPFNYQAGTQVLTPGTQIYALPSNAGVVDWESFFLNPQNTVTNGAFTSDITSWTDLSTGTGSSAYTSDGNGRLRLAAGASGTAAVEQALTVIANEPYRILVRTFTGTINVTVGTTSGGTDVLASTALTIENAGQGTWHQVVFTPTASTVYLGFNSTTNANHDVDIVKVYRQANSVQLKYISYQQWRDMYKARDFDMSPEAYTKARYVFPTQNDEFGVSPHVDEDYEITFDYWSVLTALSADTDTVPIPDRYSHVVENGAMYYAYLFRENFESAGVMRDKFNKNLNDMRDRLIERPKRMRQAYAR